MKKRYLILLLLLSNMAISQTPKLRNTIGDGFCNDFTRKLREMPRNVLFGVHIQNNKIYFSFGNLEWFKKVFSEASDGVAIDIVRKSQFDCDASIPSEIPKGAISSVLRRDELLSRNEGGPSELLVEMGTVPQNIRENQIEGNVCFLKGNNICYYTNLIDIPRSNLDLLPMGFYTLKKTDFDSNSNEDGPQKTYSTIKKYTLYFDASKANIKNEDKTALAAILNDNKDNIAFISIEAYSSVDGSKAANQAVQRQRKDAVVSLLKSYLPRLPDTSVVEAEDWNGFRSALNLSSATDLINKTNKEVKDDLAAYAIEEDLENILKNGRRVDVRFYLRDKTTYDKLQSDSLVRIYRKAILDSNLLLARSSLEAIYYRIEDGLLNPDEIDSIAVPKTKFYSPLLSDKAILKLRTQYAGELETLNELKIARSLSPNDTIINYNYHSLAIKVQDLIEFDDSSATLAKSLDSFSLMKKEKISTQRMKINYNILLARFYRINGKYDLQDSIVNLIRSYYLKYKWNENDIYSLAKFYVMYENNSFANEIIEPAIREKRASENLIFYKINIDFFTPSSYETAFFKDLCKEAIRLNRERFCKLFNSSNKGGASFQLLDEEVLRLFYCSNCTLKKS